MGNLLFSVIIPAYNAESYLGETIESALDQKGCDIEVIVVDDGSSDGTRQVAKGFGKRVTVIRKLNGGSAAARNTGAEAASGDFLAFLDADDLWTPEKLATQRRKIDEGYRFVYTNRINIGDIGDLPAVQSDIEEMPEGRLFEQLLHRNFITNSSVVIDRRQFLELKGFNVLEMDCEDWELWLRYAAQYRVGRCMEPLVKYRLHAQGKSRKYLCMNESSLRVVSTMLNSDRCSHLPESEKRRIMADTISARAWATARAKDIPLALKLYVQALRLFPLDGGLWYDVARLLAGRI